MAQIGVNDGGTWRIPQPHVKDGGTWRAIQQVYVNDGGTWRTVYQSLVIQHTDQSLGDTQVGSPCTLSYILNSSGKVQQSIIAGTTDIEDYVSPTSGAASLEAMVTISGSALDGGSSATGTYLPLTSTRAWTISKVGFGTKLTDLTVTIREVANPSNSLTRTVSMSVEVL